MTATPTPTILDARVLTGSGGGPDKTMIHSPPYLAAAGYRMLCAYLHPPGDEGFEVLRRKAALEDTQLISIADRGPFDRGVVKRMLAVCRRERVQVWHGHDYKTNVLGLILQRFHPMRLVSTVHGWVHHTWRTRLYYFIDRMALRHYERIICVSEDLVGRCRQAGVPASRCVLIENGIDVADYCRSRPPDAARADLGLAPVATIGAAGRLSAEKGFDILIRAVDRLLAGGVEVQLMIAGEGPDRESLAQLICKLGREDRIRLLGYRPDPVELYESMDVYALSSLREGFPNVLLEAMAMEVPVVATRINGVPSLVTPGETGEIVEPDSVEQLAEALRRLLTDAERRAKYAVAGRLLVESKYSFAKRMAKLIRLYDEIGLREPNGPVKESLALAGASGSTLQHCP
jgi:glycosyltransferase involved in cell wall biosynthesis